MTEGTKQGRFMKSGVLPASPGLCTAAPQAVSLLPPPEPSRQPCDEVKVHYFHLLATAKRPQNSCLWLPWARQGEHRMPAASALGWEQERV